MGKSEFLLKFPTKAIGTCLAFLSANPLGRMSFTLLGADGSHIFFPLLIGALMKAYLLNNKFVVGGFAHVCLTR